MKFVENIITVGLFDKDSKKQEISKEAATEYIMQKIADNDLCGTIFTEGVFGIYKHHDGSVVREPSIRIEIACGEEDMKKVYKMLHEIREALNQESIMHKKTEQEIDFFED